MFKYEKNMIPVLKEYLVKKYTKSYFINEFNSGNGIADLVYSTEVEEQKRIILDYRLIYVALNFLNKKNKMIKIKKFYENTFLSKRKAIELINFLLENGNLEQIDEDNVLIKGEYVAPVKNITSIEAKLFDWKKGLCQALRYKSYSNQSYLAISKEFFHRVDLNLLKENNIGLIVVAPNEVQITLNPKIRKPSNIVAHTYLAEKFYSIIGNNLNFCVNPV